jgi:aminoglycoside phosphotransferase (APT) family kinase protein
VSTTANPGATLVAPVHAIDTARLAAYLRAHVAQITGDLAVEQYQGGQSNPTYRLTAGERRYVLRRKPPGRLLPSAHAIEREYRVMSALAATDVPVAKMHALCEDEAVIGTAFYLMEYVEVVSCGSDASGMTDERRTLRRVECARRAASVITLVGLGDLESRAITSSGRALVETVPSRCGRPDPRDGPADRMAAAACSAR